MIVPRCQTRSQASKSPPGSRVLRQTALLLLGLSVLTIAGCRGCDSSETDQEGSQKAAEEKKKKLPLEVGPLLPLLGQDLSEDERADLQPKLLVKPGHWTPTVQRMQANYDDFVGENSTTLVDDNRQPATLDHTQFTYQITRPVVLAKGREKIVEGELFVPDDAASSRVRTHLVSRDSSLQVAPTYLELVKMPSYQYFVVVLASEPSRYGFLKVTDTVRAEWEEEYDETSLPHYRVVLADATEGIPLSPNLFSWTSIGYLIWDEVDATLFTAEQQQALVDWLHWGGRLIVNGPDSLDTLRGSFLDEYLPAENNGPREISAEDLSRWSAYWGARRSGKTLSPLAPTRALSGVKLAPRPGADEVSGGAGLFFQRRVGLGSIVVSSLQLTQREFINWPGYDGFFNAALLQRPQRRFSPGPYDGLRIDWLKYRDRRLDAHLITGVRLFSRDAAGKANVLRIETESNNPLGFQESSFRTEFDRAGGLAAWSQFSPVSNASRDMLVEAAGVEMPGAGFVLGCLALYLIVLVPLNWMLFHSLGRVEWAWIAAPLIAVFGTFAVVRMAQLDIGFVRAQTEVALLELQEDYSRSLLGRYTALYSSLSTTYDVTFDQPHTVATPFPAGDEDSQRRLPDGKFEVSFQRHADTILRGLAVSSNSTRMLQSEQMIALEGPLRLGLSSRNHLQVENRTGLDLRDVVVIHRRFSDDNNRPSYDASWIGELRHDSSAVLGLTRYPFDPNQLPFPKERAQAAATSRIERLDVDALIRLSFQFPGEGDPRGTRREEYRLVGRIDEVLPGVEVTPAASQIQGVTVVLAHLQYGDFPQALPDVNSRSDVVTNTSNFLED